MNRAMQKACYLVNAKVVCTAFYGHPVEEGCWWFPIVRHGQKCFGVRGFRAGEFVGVLEHALRDIQLRPTEETHFNRLSGRVLSSPSAAIDPSVKLTSAIAGLWCSCALSRLSNAAAWSWTCQSAETLPAQPESL
jgi:hypothetical protein